MRHPGIFQVVRDAGHQIEKNKYIDAGIKDREGWKKHESGNIASIQCFP